MRFSLRYRLLASFLLLMVITLATAALPLLVMLRQLPAPREESLRVLRKSIDEHGFLSLADERSFQPDVLGLLNLGEHEFKFLMSYLNGMELLFERSVFGRDSRILSRAPFSPAHSISYQSTGSDFARTAGQKRREYGIPFARHLWDAGK